MVFAAMCVMGLTLAVAVLAFCGRLAQEDRLASHECDMAHLRDAGDYTKSVADLAINSAHSCVRKEEQLLKEVEELKKTVAEIPRLAKCETCGKLDFVSEMESVFAPNIASGTFDFGDGKRPWVFHGSRNGYVHPTCRANSDYDRRAKARGKK